MRVLLTGAAGFIGSHVHRAMAAAGHEVVAVDALLEAVHGVVPETPEGILRIDIRDPEALTPLLRGIDVVVHLAAALPPGSLVMPPGSMGHGARVTEPISVSGAPAVEQGTRRDTRPPVGTGGGAQRSGSGGGQPGGGAGRPGSGDGQPGSGAGYVGSGDGRSGNVAGQPVTEPGPRVIGGARTGAVAAVSPAGVGVPEGAPTPGRPGGASMQGAAFFAAHNDFGTAVLLSAMEQTGVRRLILASSVSVYGEGRYRGLRSGPFFPGVRRRADLDRGMFDHRAPRTGEILTWEPVGEDAPLRPRTPYAASKVAQENYAMAWGAATGGAVTVLRYHHAYGDPVGGNVALTAHSGVAARFRAELTSGRAPFVFEDGGQVRDFVHVRDVAAATVAVAQRPLSGFVPLNIASGRPITLWEVASIMSRACGGPVPVVSGQYRITDARHIVANPERVRRTVDFAAAIAPDRGLADYAIALAKP
ncbi:nucleoside-diphosphate-sugar epimerase [Nocardia sp. GAS34]